MAHIRLIYAKRDEAKDIVHVIVCTSVTVSGDLIHYKKVDGPQDYTKTLSGIRWYHVCADIYFIE